jgi:hypothetical protein
MKTYLLKRDKTPVSFILQARDLPTKRLLYYDESKNKNRSLRYASNQDSPFVDEQDNDSVILEPIVFRDGVLNVDDKNPVLIKFLECHPDNGKTFYEFDPIKEAEEFIKNEELILDAQIACRELPIERMASMLRIFTNRNVDNMDAKTIKWECMQLAKSMPTEFLEAIDDPELELDDIAVRAINDGFVSIRNNGRDIHYNLKDNKKRLMTVPLNERPESALSAWLQSDDGLEFFQYLRNHYDNE